MRTLTQAFQIIKIIKLYSWEKYFINKITNERNDELKYFKKTNMINVYTNRGYCEYEPTTISPNFVEALYSSERDIKKPG
jgi:hypothetical protein